MLATADASFIRQLKAPRSGFLSVGFKHSLTTVPRGQAECQWYPPRDGSRPKAVIVFFPGNPGLVEYYPPFLRTLQSLIPPSYALLSMGHVGHSLSLSFQTQALTLDEQVAVKVEFMRRLRQELDSWAEGEPTGGARTTTGLMGHSVGAEMAVRTLRALESTPENSTSTRTTAAFLLFPTLAHIARTPNGHRLAPLFHSPLLELAPLLLMLFKPVFLLLNLLHYLIPSLATASSPSVYAPNPTTLKFLETPIVVSHVLRLARSEMETIKEPDLKWYAQNGQAGNGRVFSYWGVDDGWVGKEGDAVKEALRGEQEEKSDEEGVAGLIECKDNIPHAFCLGNSQLAQRQGFTDTRFPPAHSDIIAQKVAEWVKQAFKQKQL